MDETRIMDEQLDHKSKKIAELQKLILKQQSDCGDKIWEQEEIIRNLERHL